ncbi:MAG TPA: hypothetical protein DEB17_00590 [Chlorobaculum sp.]|uniref:Uncharacterized protein n=1 Tax=Chlorobaculum tepidum (strain ATCC 49652 / DSM 12025 / NBRC 103806 / TLS) TaxID=194439 RepID=Q8KBY9_CHLTE|nr:hypothetical protein CT1643 [Chlorobaculum tepidum TLS]HBU22497.1 hypothetical protein [Chlorobaculum sp.]
MDDPAIMWNAGNIRGRHPQLRLTKGFKSGEKSRVEVAVAVARTIGETNVSGADSGKDATMPSIQGHLALSTHSSSRRNRQPSLFQAITNRRNGIRRLTKRMKLSTRGHACSNCRCHWATSCFLPVSFSPERISTITGKASVRAATAPKPSVRTEAGLPCATRQARRRR